LPCAQVKSLVPGQADELYICVAQNRKVGGMTKKEGGGKGYVSVREQDDDVDEDEGKSDRFPSAVVRLQFK
jgi:hypothetical protein